MAKQGLNEVWKGDKSPIAQLTEDLRISRSELDMYTVSIAKTAEALKGITAEAQKAKANKDSGTGLAGLQSTNDEHKRAVELLKAEKAARKELERATKEAEKARLEEIRLMKAREKAFDDYDKRLSKEQAQQSKLSSIYSKVDQKLSKLVVEYRDLAIKKELNIKLTDSEARRMDFLANKITLYDKALKGTDASSGKFQRNVGNYKSTFDGLSNSVNQITREAPAAAVSMNTFFLAISNNLPMFFDEIGKLKKANIELVKSGEAPVSIMKKLGSAVFSVGSLLSLSVTLLTLFGGKLIDFVGSLFKASDAELELAAATKAANKERKLHNEEIKKSAEFIGNESAEMVGYLLQLKKTNQGSKERSKLIAEINEQYGTTLKNMSDEAMFQQQINGEIAKYIEYQRQLYKIKRNTEFIERNLSTQEKAQIRINELMREYNQYVREYNKNKKESPDFFKEEAKTLGEYRNSFYEFDDALTEQERILASAKDRIKQYGLNLLDANNAVDEFGYNTKESTQAIKDNNTALDSGNFSLQERLNLQSKLAKVIQDIYSINTENFIDSFNDNVVNELVNQFESIRVSGEYNVEQLEKFIHAQYEIRRNLAQEQTVFEIEEAKKRYHEERTLALEDLDKQKAERRQAILDSKASEAQKFADLAELEKNYYEQIDKINEKDFQNQLVRNEEERLAYEQLKQKLVEITKEESDKINEVNDQLSEKAIERAAKENEESLRIAKKREDDELKIYKTRLLRAGLNQDEINELVLKKQIEQTKKLLDLEEAAGHDTVDLELKYEELKQQLRDKEKKDETKHQKDLVELRKKAINELLDAEIRASKRKEDAIGKEIDANKKAQDQLQAAANAGVDTAQDSLAKLKEIEIEKTKAQQKEAKKQESLERIKVAYQLFEQFISKGDNVATAGGKTLSGMSVLTALINGFKKFFHGTDDTGKTGQLKDQYGNITGVTHENEQVWSVEDRKAVGFKSRKEIKEAVKIAESGGLNPIFYNASVKKDSFAMGQKVQERESFKPVLNELQKLQRIISDKPDQTFSVEMVEGIGKAVVATLKKGNDKITKIYSA